MLNPDTILEHARRLRNILAPPDSRDSALDSLTTRVLVEALCAAMNDELRRLVVPCCTASLDDVD